MRAFRPWLAVTLALASCGTESADSCRDEEGRCGAEMLTAKNSEKIKDASSPVDQKVTQAANAGLDCGTAMRELPLPRIDRIILRVSGDIPETNISEIFEYYEPRFSDIGIILQRGEEACASGDLFMHYDLSGPGAGRMSTCRAGREFEAKLNGDHPSADFVRVGLENVYQQEKCRRQSQGNQR